MSTLGVIPARLGSMRLAQKALKDIGGKPLIQHVWEQARQASFAQLIVATDSKEIFDCANRFGANAMMTSSKHETGTDRVCEVMQILAKQGQVFDLVANVQGDMPFINAKLIDATVSALAKAPLSFGMSTLATAIIDEEEYLRPSAVKVALANDNAALYFSRAPIPCWRDKPDEIFDEQNPRAWRHIGLYVFRPEALSKLATMPQSLPERREKLEQLRALCAGIRILVHVAKNSELQKQVEVDTAEDLERARALLR